jgi:hypothetical protein
MAVSLPVVAAIVCGVPVVRHAQLETRLAAAAGALAHARVTVRCETVGQAWLDVHPERGYVRVGPDGAPEHHAVVTYDTCNDLADWIGSSHTSPTDAQVTAVHVLTHEAMHMAGILDESKAECAAVQRDAQMAQLLGATAEEARSLAHRYWNVVYPSLPDAYRDGGCASAGAMDEHLKGPPWD